jgi:hypothetical protein
VKLSALIQVMSSETPYIAALFWAHARVDASFSIAMMFVQRSDNANAIVFPPAPANMSIIVVFSSDAFSERSIAI